MSELLIVKLWIFQISLVAAGIYLFSVYIGTRYLKKVWSIHPVFLSWIISIPAFIGIHFVSPQELTPPVFIQYIILTLTLNGGLKVVHQAWDLAGRYFIWIPKRIK